MFCHPPSIISLLLLTLLACGPPSPQDAAQDTEAGESNLSAVLRREELFHSAYGALDAAILQRILHDDFVITYTQPPAEKDKARFVHELGELRVVFPDLQLTVDSSSVLRRQEGIQVTGSRTFRWHYAGEAGSYAERFRHFWVAGSGGYQLLRAEVLPPPEE